MILVIGGEKGGTGKTTIAFHMAYMRTISGRNALLVDADPQKSASMYIAVRSSEEREPAISCVQKTAAHVGSEAATIKAIGAELMDLAKTYDDVIVDTGGRDSVELKAAIGAADRLLIPVKASQLDLWPLQKIHNYLELSGDDLLRGRLVFTQVPTIPGFRERKIKRTRDALVAWNLPRLEISDCVVYTRDYYTRAVEYGAAVFEDIPDDDEERKRKSDIKASLEMMQLYTDIFGETKEEFTRAIRAFLRHPDLPAAIEPAATPRPEEAAA
jgi:chromosome partitioning protein